MPCHRAFFGAASALVEHLKEDFVLAYHAELAAGALLYRFETLLQIAHFGIERGVARFSRALISRCAAIC